jgi:hypothetical protein
MYYVFDIIKDSIIKGSVVVDAVSEKEAESSLNKNFHGFRFNLVRSTIVLVTSESKNDEN